MNPYTHDEHLTEAQKEQVDASYDALLTVPYLLYAGVRRFTARTA